MARQQEPELINPNVVLEHYTKLWRAETSSVSSRAPFLQAGVRVMAGLVNALTEHGINVGDPRTAALVFEAAMWSGIALREVSWKPTEGQVIVEPYLPAEGPGVIHTLARMRALCGWAPAPGHKHCERPAAHNSDKDSLHDFSGAP